jgi:hypothetical protein
MAGDYLERSGSVGAPSPQPSPRTRGEGVASADARASPHPHRLTLLTVAASIRGCEGRPGDGKGMSFRIAIVQPILHRPGDGERNVADAVRCPQWQRPELYDAIYPRPPREAAE